MELKNEDLLAFCAYYNLAKTAIRLPLASMPRPTINKNEERNKNEKVIRKKMEIV